jgi:hypothetical protein
VLRRINWTMVSAIPLYWTPWNKVRELQAASLVESELFLFVPNLSCLYPAYVRGEAYLAAGQGTAAATEFQQILDLPVSCGIAGQER